MIKKTKTKRNKFEQSVYKRNIEIESKRNKIEIKRNKIEIKRNKMKQYKMK